MSAKRSAATRWPLIMAAGASLVYAWIAAGLRPYTAPENVLVALPVVPVVLLAARRGPPRPDRTPQFEKSRPRRGAVVWVALLVALAAWELKALFSSPRRDHPTLSYLIDRIMSVHVGRTVIFICWLVLGAALALRATRAVSR